MTWLDLLRHKVGFNSKYRMAEEKRRLRLNRWEQTAAKAKQFRLNMADQMLKSKLRKQIKMGSKYA